MCLAAKCWKRAARRASAATKRDWCLLAMLGVQVSAKTVSGVDIGRRKINESVCGGERRQRLLLEIEVLRHLLILLGPAVGLATGFRLQLEVALLAAPPPGQLARLLLVDQLELAAPERGGALGELGVRDGAQGGSGERPAGKVGPGEAAGGAVLELLEFRQRVRLFTPPLQLYKDILGTHPSLLNYIENQRFNVADYRSSYSPPS